MRRKILFLVLFCLIDIMIIVVIIIWNNNKNLNKDILINTPSNISINKSEITQTIFLPTQLDNSKLIPTEYSTLSSKNEEILFNLLNQNNCILPCYINITPGKTTWNQAQIIMNQIGAIYLGDYTEYKTELKGYAYMGILGNDINSQNDYEFTVDKGIVQRFQIIVEMDNLSLYNTYWSQYSIQKLLSQLGSPESIYFQILQIEQIYAENIIYRNLGIVIETHGIIKDKMICDQIPEDNPRHIVVGIHLILTNMESSLKISPNDSISPDDQSIYMPILKALGIDENIYRDH